VRIFAFEFPYSIGQPSVVRQYNSLSMISQDLLDILVCPICKKPVVLNANGQGLKCGVCRRVYPVQDDIPIMLIDVASIDVL
jgi:uncharacterized protein